MNQNFYLTGCGEYMDLSHSTRSGFLRFSAPGGRTFDLQISADQLSTVLGHVAAQQGAPKGTPSTPQAERKAQSLDLSKRGAVETEPIEHEEEEEGDPDMEPPVILSIPRYPREDEL